MSNLNFTEEDREILNYERFHHPHPRVQLKMEVWLSWVCGRKCILGYGFRQRSVLKALQDLIQVTLITKYPGDPIQRWWLRRCLTGGSTFTSRYR